MHEDLDKMTATVRGQQDVKPLVNGLQLRQIAREPTTRLSLDSLCGGDPTAVLALLCADDEGLAGGVDDVGGDVVELVEV